MKKVRVVRQKDNKARLNNGEINNQTTKTSKQSDKISQNFPRSSIQL
jgi:hypothetical protein